jgi:phage gp29-like protein
MIGWCERSESKAILGSTLTSDAAPTGLGSSLAEIHNEVRLDIRDSDCKQLAATVTRHLIYPLLALNKGWADVRRCPRMVFDTAQAADLKLFADSLPKLVENGMRISVQWAHERLRIPLAAEDEPVLAPAAKPQAAKPQAKASAALAALTAKFPDQDALDKALTGLAPQMQSITQQWLKPAPAALKAAPSPEAALELLASENPLTDDAVLTEALARALFVAELLGEDGVRQELNDDA